MAITVNSTPSFLASQAGCDAKIKLSSDSIFLTAGTYYTVQYLFITAAISAGETFSLGGYTFTFVASTPANGFEIQISGTPLTFAENIADALNVYVWGFTSYGVDFFSNPVVGVIANNTGDVEDLGFVDNTGGAIFTLSEVEGADADVNEGCVIEYESYIDNCLIYAGTVPFIPTRDESCASAESLLNLDLTFIINATKKLFSESDGGTGFGGGVTSGTRLNTDRYKIIKIRVRECCAGTKGSWTLLEDIPVLFSSCDCQELPVTGVLPKTQSDLSPTQWLNIFKTTNEVYAGSTYRVCCIVPDENLEIEGETPLIGAVSSATIAPPSSGILCFNVVAVIQDLFPAITNGAEVTLTLKGSLGGGSSFLAETLTFIYKSTSQCCVPVQFLNCWGTHQTFYVSKERDQGVEVLSETYLGTSAGIRYTRDFSRTSSRRRTFWTRDLRYKDEDKSLLEAFLSSTSHIFPADGLDEWELEVGEYSYRTESGGLQVPLVFTKRRKGISLVNH